MGAKRTKSSGSGAREKADMTRVEDGFLIETKSTRKKSFALTKEILGRIEQQANDKGLDPMVALVFTEPGQVVERDWVVIPQTVLLRLLRTKR